jgi:hypothetical protein
LNDFCSIKKYADLILKSIIEIVLIWKLPIDFNIFFKNRHERKLEQTNHKCDFKKSPNSNNHLSLHAKWKKRLDKKLPQYQKCKNYRTKHNGEDREKNSGDKVVFKVNRDVYMRKSEIMREEYEKNKK